MSVSKTNQIRQIIRQTKLQSAEVAQLRAIVLESIPRLHGAIQLPHKDGEAALTDFVLRYIEHVPNFIDALRGLTQEAGIHDYASIFLELAEDFFLEPPEAVGALTGLNALLSEAYLAHRLIEEVNDRVVGRCGIPLAPMDMTRANLIVHQLIGEPFANDLDFVVHYSTELHIGKEQLMENDAFHRYVHEHRTRGWDIELGRWPCLAEDLSINIAFPADVEPRAVH